MATLTTLPPSKIVPGGPKWIVRSLAGETTHHLHEKAKLEWKKQDRAEQDLQGENIAFDLVARQYLEGLSSSCAISTVCFNRWLMGYLFDEFGDTPVRRISTEHIRDLRARLCSHSSPSVYLAINLLTKVLSLAVDLKFLTTHPCDALPPRPLPAVSRARMKEKSLPIPSEAEVRFMLRVSTGFVRTFVLLTLMAGLRIGEAIALPWRAVLFDRRLLNIYTAATPSGEVKTYESDRYVPMADKLYDVLSELHTKLKPGPDDTVIVDDRGLTPNYKAMKTAFYLWQSRNGLCETRMLHKNTAYRAFRGHITPHAMRHAAATLWIWAGVDDESIQAWLGHAHPEETFDTYAHFFSEYEGGEPTWIAEPRRIDWDQPSPKGES